MKHIVLIVIAAVFVKEVYNVMIKQECGHDEVHKSCSFTDEHMCWDAKNKLRRIKVLPKRLPHCMQGCFCRKGYVREFPHGRCIPAMRCRDQSLMQVIKKIPNEYGDNIRFNKFNLQD